MRGHRHSARRPGGRRGRRRHAPRGAAGQATAGARGGRDGVGGRSGGGRGDGRQPCGSDSAVHLRAPVHGHRGADGPDTAAHLRLDQHQGAARLLLRHLRPARRASGQRPPHPGAPGRDAGRGAGAAGAVGRRHLAGRCARVQPPAAGGRLPPARHHGHHPGLCARRRRRARVLGRVPWPPRRHWRFNAGFHAALLALARRGGRADRGLQAGGQGPVHGGGHQADPEQVEEPGRQRVRPQGAGGCQHDGPEPAPCARLRVVAPDRLLVHGPHPGQRRGLGQSHAPRIRRLDRHGRPRLRPRP
mmetsp:Transcript_22507/g.72759  ORF Transcript_22507/g.72759 Transcript_22507/m.72759 type:complete len:302 (+) Transcript_22507:1236-2141(+)